jgi:hypothetical protein
MDGMRLPDDGRVVTGAPSSDECESACLGNCGCSAYAYNGSCVLWNGELQNLQEGYGNQLAGAGSLYLRLAVSEFPRARSHKRRTVEVAVDATAIVCFVLTASILVVGSSGRPTSGASAATSTAPAAAAYALRGHHLLES